MAKSRKFRVQLRKNRSTRKRSGNLTRAVASDAEHTADAATSERISGKGDLTRKRMMSMPLPVGGDSLAGPVQPLDGTWRGQVLLVHGLESFVRDGTGTIVRCTTSRLLRTVFTEQRHPVAAGDWACVLGEPGDGPARGTIVSVESRRNSLCRWSRGRRHVIVANVDQTLIVGSAAMPDLKPALIDRFIVAAESSGIRPIICINKVDLVDPARLVPLAGVFARMGYPVVLCSTVSGVGLERLKTELTNRVTAIVGQSGVGKSSILNALDPVLDLPVAEVSRDNEKGRHTTTTARLIPHARGGSFVDTPGIRQFQLWEIIAAEVPAAFRDLRPLANRCRFPDCSHTHESGCAVKDAVADGLLDTRRWESCCHLAAHAENQPEESDE
ncbi:MAG: ribosome small subunit-dependent GTPase A [Planctomycetia bacterium]|nr:ribosome small subunit-dependent GTPase A [Planctomycetia bacterium]RLT12712.1 MAG: ribosome small subunit-dependent GTPase A [Planctomycetota bacterium]